MSGSTDLRAVLHLGDQHLTGVFPERPDDSITRGPLELVFCPEGGLLQLHHSYDLREMYGLNYGYRSGLNRSMVQHLQSKVHELERRMTPRPGDIVVDIGSNDATLLRSYRQPGLRRLGIDPTGIKFAEYYPADVQLVPDFFSADAYRAVFGNEGAHIVTSVAMFYDLEDPLAFVRDVASILAPDGIWHLEQSYMPAMLEATAYDTICHEHLEYYALQQIQWMTERAGLKILDVTMNDANGGSFAVTVAHESASMRSDEAAIAELIERERRMGLCTETPYREFAQRVFAHRDALRSTVRELNARGKTVFGYGASTKGNVLLQFCGFTPEDIPFIAEVNPFKFGRFTPGTGIPIISEREAHALAPDYFLVLPWHFRDNILSRERQYLAEGGRLIFPLPDVNIVGGETVHPRPRPAPVFVDSTPSPAPAHFVDGVR